MNDNDRLITVFGASGFIGRYVVRALAKAGYRVRAAVRNPGTANFLRPMGHVGQIQIVQANVRVAATIDNALEDAWGVINLVGVLVEQGARFGPLHAKAPQMIAELARRRGLEAMVHVSALGAREDSPSLYQRTKALGESAVKHAFPQAVILRPSLVFGPEDEFFNRFAAIARLSPVLPLFGGGATRFQPVFCADVGAAALAAAHNPRHWGTTFELGGPIVYSFRQLMEEILKVTDRKRLLLPLPWMAAEAVAAGVSLVPVKPLITSDQIKQLRQDNVLSHAPGIGALADLGIAPRTLEAELPSYLWRFRKSGQFEVSGYA
jgi:uncharacterized protein YbjT (DUF2867 family)